MVNFHLFFNIHIWKESLKFIENWLQLTKIHRKSDNKSTRIGENCSKIVKNNSKLIENLLNKSWKCRALVKKQGIVLKKNVKINRKYGKNGKKWPKIGLKIDIISEKWPQIVANHWSLSKKLTKMVETWRNLVKNMKTKWLLTIKNCVEMPKIYQ